MDNYWPLGIFMPKYPLWQDLIVLLAIVFLWLCFLHFWQKKARITILILLFGAFMIATNLLQGIKPGFIDPLSNTDSTQTNYWWDVEKMTDIPSLLRTYTQIQPTLARHTRTHPPGTIIFLFLAKQIFYYPFIITLFILSLGLLSLYLFYDFIKTQVSQRTAILCTSILGLLPALQIYFIVTIDTIIFLSFTACLWAFNKLNQNQWVIISVLLLYIASVFNFAFIFLLPILLFMDYRQNNSINRSLLIIALFFIIHFLTFILFDYNYFQSFIIASKIENPGFYFLTQPLSYFISRIENVLEILIFLGPVLTYLLYQNFKSFKPWQKLKSFANIGYFGILILLGMYITGAYYTGETARNGIYIFPYLITPIAILLDKWQLTVKQEVILLNFVFFQSLLMQTFGWWAW